MAPDPDRRGAGGVAAIKRTTNLTASKHRATTARRTQPSGSGKKPDWPPIYNEKTTI